MADSQRSKAAALVDSDVMTLGRETQRTRKTTNPVAQANMSKYGPANPQPRLTPTSIPFKKGGKVKMAMGGMPPQAQGNAYGRMGVMPPNAQGLANRPAMPMQAQGVRPFKKGGSAKAGAKKAAAVAGMLSALAQGAPMGAAPPAAPAMAGPMGAPPGMKRGGRKMAMGGKATDDEGNRMNGMKRGGATHVPMRGAANHKPDSGTGGNLVPRNKAGRAAYAKGGKVHSDEAEDKVLIRREIKKAEASEKPGMKKGGRCMKCGGMAHGGACKMAHGGRTGYAMGGVGKQRKHQADSRGMPTKQPRKSYEDSLI